MNNAANELTIHVTLLLKEERTISIKVKSGTTIQELKELIESMEGIAVNSQRLIYLGRYLNTGNKRIADCGIEDGCTIHLSVIPKEPLIAPSETTYVKQRKLYIKALEGISSNTTIDAPILQYNMQQAGARLPSGGDSVHYPVGSDYEYLRQNLISMSTLLSYVSIPSNITLPSQVNFGKTVACGAGHRQFYVGQWVDALDTVNKWLEATVMDVRKEYVYVHYSGWDKQWDEWIHIDSPRIALFRTYTKQPNERSNASPDIISWASEATPTAADDLYAIIQAIIRTAIPSLTMTKDIVNLYVRKDEENTTYAKEDGLSVLRSIAPILERVGKCVTDMAGLLHYLGEGGKGQFVNGCTNKQSEAQASHAPTEPPVNSSETYNDIHSIVEMMNRSGLESDKLIPLVTLVSPESLLSLMRRLSSGDTLSTIVAQYQNTMQSTEPTSRNGNQDEEREKGAESVSISDTIEKNKNAVKPASLKSRLQKLGVLNPSPPQ